METREAIKKEVDKLPDYCLDSVYQFIHSLSEVKKKKHTLKTFRLNGQFDNVDIRKEAYG